MSSDSGITVGHTHLNDLFFFPSVSSNQQDNKDVEVCRSADCTRPKDVKWSEKDAWLPLLLLMFSTTNSTSRGCDQSKTTNTVPLLTFNYLGVRAVADNSSLIIEKKLI